MDQLPNIPTQSYSDLHPKIQSGDILLCSGSSFFSNMIKQATNSIWSHVAFILRLDQIDRIMVLESVESIGVRAVTLNSYLANYNGTGKAYPGKMMLARHQKIKPENIPKLSREATDLLGYPYDNQEIIRIAARIGLGPLAANSAREETTSPREFICSEYAYTCFKSIGISIEYEQAGYITPADFARCDQVNPLWLLQT